MLQRHQGMLQRRYGRFREGGRAFRRRGGTFRNVSGTLPCVARAIRSVSPELRSAPGAVRVAKSLRVPQSLRSILARGARHLPEIRLRRCAVADREAASLLLAARIEGRRVAEKSPMAIWPVRGPGLTRAAGPRARRTADSYRPLCRLGDNLIADNAESSKRPSLPRVEER